LFPPLRYILTNRDYSLFASYDYNPDYPEPIDDIGIPFTTSVALKKLSEDIPGDGSGGSRSRGFHREF